MNKDTTFSAAHAGARYVEGFGFPISRRTDPVSIRPGTRVVVRYRVPSDAASNGATSAVTDAIGVLRSINPLQVEDVVIADEDVVVLKTLSAKPVRNSDIRALEAAKAAAFPGIDNQMIGGWLARAGDGITERSNSAVPIGPSAGLQEVPLAQLEEFYRSHDLPCQLMIPDRIGRPAEHLPGVRGPEILVMSKELGSPTESQTLAPSLADAQIELTVDDTPDADWLSMYKFRGQPLPKKALDLLCHRIDGQLGFARLMVDGQLAAITRATITDGWLGYSAVAVAPEFRRRGLGTLLCQHLLSWGADNGADRAYLDVIDSNTAGKALYHKLGFSEHHRSRSLRTR
ncbi:GNAT family N-acetyltransferase [Corynebacterium jeikeium]|jgi:N-acetylglutamate synthase|uniref:N-acetylglutamate synthase, CG3035 family n=1 Tax=Corynebacterium jeikeium TaxID=38289 RepID=UPI000557EFEB|nr:GNAT family N-acetyltransferase [Corynebacterium jeikeium]